MHNKARQGGLFNVLTRQGHATGDFRKQTCASNSWTEDQEETRPGIPAYVEKLPAKCRRLSTIQVADPQLTS